MKHFKATKDNKLENRYELCIYDDSIEISRYGDSGAFFCYDNCFDLTDILQIEALEKEYKRIAFEEIKMNFRDKEDLEYLMLASEMWYNGLVIFDELKSGYVEFEEE